MRKISKLLLLLSLMGCAHSPVSREKIKDRSPNIWYLQKFPQGETRGFKYIYDSKGNYSGMRGFFKGKDSTLFYTENQQEWKKEKLPKEIKEQLNLIN